jgi:hypothetical protein
MALPTRLSEFNDLQARVDAPMQRSNMRTAASAVLSSMCRPFAQSIGASGVRFRLVPISECLQERDAFIFLFIGQAEPTYLVIQVV